MKLFHGVHSAFYFILASARSTPSTSSSLYSSSVKGNPTIKNLAPSSRNDKGFTLIELVVAMALIGLIFLLTTPVFLMSMRMAALNTTVTSATASVHTTIEAVRRAPVTCETLLAQEGTKNYTDARGDAYSVSVVLPDGCDVDEVAVAVPVEVTSVRTLDSNQIIHVDMRVFVAGSETRT